MKKAAPAAQVIVFKASRELQDAIRAQAEAEDRTVSAWVRLALTKLLRDAPQQPVNR